MSEFLLKIFKPTDKKLALTAMRHLHLCFKKERFWHHLLYLTKMMVCLTLRIRYKLGFSRISTFKSS